MFQSCLNPQRVFNSSLGQYIQVSCGHCEWCADQRRRIWARRLELHAQTSVFVLFFTLTYDNYHLPKIYYNEKGIVTNFTRTQEFDFYNRHTKERKTITKIIESDEYNGLNVFTLEPGDKVTKPPHYVFRRRFNREPIFDNRNRFAIAYKKDFQLFIMRCRTNLRRFYDGSDFDPSFTYFGVSEYGPDTYRPHFHGLLFFRERPADVSALLSVLSKSWAKSPLSKIGKEFEIVRQKTASTKYVSKYVVKDSTLPRLLLTPEFRTTSFKSISIPLGSESFNIPDVPAIFSKGTLLYDKQYYDKKKCCFVPYKCSFPSVSWQRIFPRLLGRRLLSVSDLRQCFNKIFDYKDCPEKLPNLIDEFPKKYPIGRNANLIDDAFIDDYIKRYHGFDDPFSYPNLLDYRLNTSSIQNYEFAKATYSVFFSRLLSQDLDFFLFGIPQNRTFCKKVLAHARSAEKYGFLGIVEDYLQYYLRYETISFTDSIRYIHEQYEQFSVPYEFASIYSDFYDKLYSKISDYGSEQVTRLDMILSNFNLSLCMFYHDDGTKKKFDFTLERDCISFDYHQQLESRKVNSIHQSNIHEDL